MKFLPSTTFGAGTKFSADFSLVTKGVYGRDGTEKEYAENTVKFGYLLLLNL